MNRITVTYEPNYCDVWIDLLWRMNRITVTYEPNYSDLWTELLWRMNRITVTYEPNYCDVWTELLWRMNWITVTYELNYCDIWTEFLNYFYINFANQNGGRQESEIKERILKLHSAICLVQLRKTTKKKR